MPSAATLIRSSLPRRSFVLARAALRVEGRVARRALVDRRVAVRRERVRVVAGREVQVALGVEVDLAAGVAADAAVGRDLEDLLLGREVERAGVGQLDRARAGCGPCTASNARRRRSGRRRTAWSAAARSRRRPSGWSRSRRRSRCPAGRPRRASRPGSSPASDVVAFGVVSQTRPSREVCSTRRSGSTAIAIGSPVLSAPLASVGDLEVVVGRNLRGGRAPGTRTGRPAGTTTTSDDSSILALSSTALRTRQAN